MKIAIIGATGVVGNKMLQVLEERNIYPEEIILAASENSVGKRLKFRDTRVNVVSIKTALEKNPDIALFSAGATISREWAKEFTSRGSYVIDNSSAWRNHANIPLIVPEVNQGRINKDDKLIANPNCSTIQLVHVLKPLHDKYGLKRVVVSTYQSVTGSGLKGIQQMEKERKGEMNNLAYPYQIDKNCLPHGGDFGDNDYTSEEMKLINESRKILGLPKLRITGTVVRIPVTGGHSESVNITFENKPNIIEIRQLLSNTPGIIVQDDPTSFYYPMPITAEDKDETFVGRIRKDDSEENSINLWIVADNLRKGAATNSVQIAEQIISKGFVNGN